MANEHALASPYLSIIFTIVYTLGRKAASELDILAIMNSRMLLPLGLTFMMACSGTGGGCTDCAGMAVAPYPDPAPAGGELQTDVVRARVTQSALDFFGSNLDSLLASFFVVEGNQAKFYIDESMLGTDSPILFREGAHLSMDLETLKNSLSLEWVPAADDADAASQTPAIRISLRDLELFADMILLTNLDTNLIPGAACHIRSPANSPAIRVQEISFDVGFGVDSSSGSNILDITPENIIIDFGTESQQANIAVDITPCDGSHPTDPTCVDPACSVEDANCPDLCEILDLASDLGDFLLAVLDPVMVEIGQSLESVIGDALSDALAGIPVGVETELDMAALLGEMFRGAQPLNVKVGASNLGVAGTGPGRGLDLGFLGGLTTMTPAACAQLAEAPDIASLIGTPPEFTGFVEIQDENGASHFEAYHMAFGASQAMITQAAWGLFQSGLLCLGLDSYEIGAMTGGQFDVTAGLLMNFEPRLLGIAEMQSPIQISITARDAPRIRLGAGTEIATGVHDPLMQVALDDVQIDISMLIDDAMVRVSGLTADIALNMDILRKEDHTLQLAVDDIVIANTQQIYNELVPDADLTQLFETLVDIAISLLVGDNLNFDIDIADVLGSALGTPVELRLNTIRRDLGAEGSPYISVYASLCSPDQVANSENTMCYTPPPTPDTEETVGENDANSQPEADNASMYRALPRNDLPARWMAMPSGEVLVKVGATQNRAYQYRVNGGAWWTGKRVTADSLWVKSPQLYRHGKHTIEIRSHEDTRFWHTYKHQNLEVLVDPDKPVLSYQQSGNTLTLEVDELTTPDDVQLFKRMSGEGTWVSTEAEILVTGQSGVLEVMAIDGAGNQSDLIKVELKQYHPGSTASGSILSSGETEAEGGCAAAPVGLWWLLAGLFFVRKRRQ